MSSLAMAPPHGSAGPGRSISARLPLREVEFVVLDLETTGHDPQHAAITEVGAVLVHGGQVREELHTLIDPGRFVPAPVIELNGITDEMLRFAPPIACVLPWVLQLCAGRVLVAHHAPFDLGFLRHAAEGVGIAWVTPLVVDTLQLARRVLRPDEVPDHRLGTLASLFRSPVTPTHRALADARATAHVLLGLVARLDEDCSLTDLLRIANQEDIP
ncbi:MAG: exonuclease domain-containing protein [Angustibacter sp.]